MSLNAPIQGLLRTNLFLLVVCCARWNCAQADEGPASEPQRLTGHKYPIIQAAFSGDGKQVAVLANKAAKPTEQGKGWTVDGEADWQVVVWDVQHRTMIHSLASDDLPVDPGLNRPGQFFPEIPSLPHMLDFSRNGEIVSLAGMGAQVQLFDAKTGKLRKPLLVMAKNSPFAVMGVSQLAISPDAKLIAVCRQQGLYTVLQLYNAVTGRPTRVLHGKLALGDIEILEFSADSGRLVGAGPGPKLWIWDVKSGKAANIDTSQVFIDRVYLSADGKTVIGYCSDGEGAFHTWDITSRKLLKSVGDTVTPKGDNNSNLWIGSSAFSADGSRLATINAKRQVLVLDVETGKLLQALDTTTETPFCVAVSPDGKTLATGGFNGKDLLLWKVAPRPSK